MASLISRLRLVHNVWIVALISLGSQSAQATLYRYGPVNGFTTGNLGSVGGAEGWTTSAAYCTVTAGSGSLNGTGLGLAGSRGDKAATTSGTGNTYLLFANGSDIDIAAGNKVYFSCLYQINTVADVAAAGESILTLRLQNSGSTTYFDVLVKNVSGNIQVGVQKSGGTANYITSGAGSSIAQGTTFLIVGSIEFVSGTGNDIAKVWVNPASLGVAEGSVPAPGASSSDGTDQTSATGPGRLYFNGGSAANFDEARVGSTWADVTPTVTGKYFRSVASGDWNVAGTWEQSADNTTWVAATTTPTKDDYTITIRSGHSVNVSADVAADEMVAAAGGTLTVPSGVTLTVANSLGTDLAVAGTLTISGTVALDFSTLDATGGSVSVNSGGVLKGLPGSAVTSTAAQLTIASGGKYQHAYTTGTGTIPTATWSTGSTCEFIGYTSGTTAAGGLGQSFYNFRWNCPNQTGNHQLSAGVTTINGDLTMASSGTGSLRYNANSPATATLNIGGNLVVTGGTLDLCSGTSVNTFNVTGQLLVSGGVLQSSGTGVPILTVNGNAGKFTVTGGGAVLLSGNLANAPGAPVANQITLDNGAFGVSGVDFTLNANAGITVNAAGGAILQASGRTLTIPGNITGPGTVVKTLTSGTTGNLTLSGVNDFSGGLTILGGGLRFNSDTCSGTGPITVTPGGGGGATCTLRNLGVSASTINNPITLNSGGNQTISFDSDPSATFTVSGKITGNTVAGTPGQVLIGGNSTGGGTIVLSGDNSWTGGLSLRRGTLALGHKNAMGASTAAFAAAESSPIATFLKATVPLTGANAVANPITFTNTGVAAPQLTISGANDLELSGPMTLLGLTSPALANNNAGATILSGAISGAGLGLILTGTGTLTLAGPSTYSGPTTINSGTVLVNGSLAAASAVSVASGATLGGKGTIGGTVTLASGAILSPGVGAIGTLTVNNTLGLSGNTIMELDRSAAQTSDQIAGLTTLTYGGTLTVNNLGPALQAGDTFTLFIASSYLNNFTTLSLPTLATGLHWDTSKLSVNGSISVQADPIVLTCSSNITVRAINPAGRVVTYGSTASGGCPPVTINCNPPSGSTFPVGTNTVICTACDSCGQCTNCTFLVTVLPPIPEYFTPYYLLPPPNTVYISPALWHVLYNNGIVIRDVRHRFFSDHLPPPPLGTNQLENFSSQVDYEVSFDNGATFSAASGTANVQVRLSLSQAEGNTSLYDTEMLQLDLVGPGFRLRESPTLQSIGQTTVRPVAGGYLIGSFFDVNTEISLDNGVSWTPAQEAGHVELRNDPATVDPVNHPSALLPPPTGVYISPQLWHALFAAGIVIKDVSHKFFTQSQPPPPTGSNALHSFDSVVDLSISTDGGTTYQFVRVNAPVTIGVRSQGSSNSRFYDTEMLSLTLNGLPGGLMLRESPSLPSRGGTQMRASGLPPGDPDFDLLRIGSFFDIFTEISLDGGNSWAGATNGPVRMELKQVSPEVVKPTPNLPPLDGNYISPSNWHALYAIGIIITNASHDRFTQNQPPPPIGGSQTENFGSRVRGMISMNGGASFQPFSAFANVSVKVDGVIESIGTKYFHTEMLSLSLSGGTLPAGVMIRESPSKASLGRTSVRTRPTGDFAIDSFFDVFTEVSLDGGATWSESVVAPGTMGLQPPTTNPPTPILLNCSNITATASNCSGGALVTYSNLATGGCSPPPTVNCNPPSGSTFPQGTNLVTCTANDTCGTTTNCSFTVTVTPPDCPPLVVTCSTNITVTLSNCTDTSAVVMYDSSVSGGCDPVTFSCNPPSGSNFPLGTTTVACSATDGCGNKTNCSFTVKVNPAPSCPPLVVICSSNITAFETVPGAATVTFGSSSSGGCPPVTVSCLPPSGSLFPLGTTLVTCSATDACGNSNSCSFKVTVVPQHFSVTNNLPPTNTVYISPRLYHLLYAQGIIIRDVRHRFFTHDLPPPPLGSTQTHTFNSQLDFEVSMDGGGTWQPVTANADVSVRVTHTSDNGNTSSFDTEMLSLTLNGTGLMLRESPTLQSLGKTSIRQIPGGYMIGSFFDVFTEVSIDGGNTWLTTDEPAHVELRNDPRAVPPVTTATPVLPSPNDAYISPAKWHALYAQGIIIKDVRHKLFTQDLLPPPPGGSNTHSFNSILDCQVSLDGGNNYQPVRVTAPVQVSVSSVGSGNSGMYETEMTQLDMSGGGLPPNIRIRESPSRPSRGGTQIDAQPDGTFRIGSFFDIFTEVSIDGGQSWSPATNGPVRVNLTPQAPEVPAPSPNVPLLNTSYVSPSDWHAAYANGIYISNVVHRGFTENFPPPQPGGTNTEHFSSTVDMLVSLDGGKTFQPGSATMGVTVQVASRPGLGQGNTQFYDTEMLQLDMSGGGLPGNIMLRESPSRPSLGRTSIRPDGAGGFRIGSFFDIFPEISTDGGQTWLPSTTPPAMMSPRLKPHVRPFPNPNLPPTNGQYISPRQWHALYANGIIITNVAHKRFLANVPPPHPRSTNIHNFGSQVNLLLHMPGQQGYTPVTANADCQVSVASSGFQSAEQVYQTEMLSLNLSGGTLPPGVMIRESPTRRSTGETHYRGAGGGGGGAGGTTRISSFFDIFTEVSMDGGQTWTPSDVPAYMELHIDPGVPPTTLVESRIDNGQLKVDVLSQMGLRYLLQYKNDINDPTWTTISITPGDGSTLTLSDTSSKPSRFYRVEVQEDDNQ